MAISDSSLPLEPAKEVETNFTVDRSSGCDLIVNFEFENSGVDVEIISPTKQTYVRSNGSMDEEFRCQEVFHSCQFHWKDAEV